MPSSLIECKVSSAAQVWREPAAMAQATLAAISHGSLDTNDAVVAVVAIMRDDGYQEGEHVEIQRECCRMMAELTAGNACTEAILASDAASMLVRAMMSLGQARGFWLALVEHAPSTLTPHPHTNPNPPRHKDAAVQWQGCRALTNLSCGGDECRKAVRDAGGANALMLAMEMHPEDLPLARLRLAPSIARAHVPAHAHARAPATPVPARPGDAVAGTARRPCATWARLGWHRGSACAARGARNPVRRLPLVHHGWRRPRTDSHAHPPAPRQLGAAPYSRGARGSRHRLSLGGGRAAAPLPSG